MAKTKVKNKEEEEKSLPPTVFELMDEEDEELIVQELAGKMLDIYVYHIFDEERGIDAYGLSAPGVDDACRYMAERGEFIRVEDMPQIFADEEGCLANVIAKRYIRDKDGNLICADSALGTKYEPRVKKKRDGTPWVDKFYREVAVSKAQRNAKAKLIPENIKITLIEKYKRVKGKVKEIKLPPEKKEKSSSPPPPETRKEGWRPDANIIEIQKLKAELVKLGVWETDKDYRKWLSENFENEKREPITSSKNLSDKQRKEAIDMMKKMIESVRKTEKIEKNISEKAEQKIMFQEGQYAKDPN